MKMEKSEIVACQEIVGSLEAVLARLDAVDGLVTKLQSELGQIPQEISHSRQEVEKTKQILSHVEQEQGNTEKMRSMVSRTLEEMFQEMSQVVNSARGRLLQKTEEEKPAETKPDTAPSMEEVHETLREVAQTLVAEENLEVCAETEIPKPEFLQNSLENEIMETPEPTSPLSGLQELLLKGKNDDSGQNSDLPISSEPPALLKETLMATDSVSEITKTNSSSFPGVETDLGKEDVGTTAEMNALMEKLSSSYMATPEH